MGQAITLTPAEPHYDGKIVVLVDESSLSQAEYTAIALQSAPHTVVVGSTTAGGLTQMFRVFLCRVACAPPSVDWAFSILMGLRRSGSGFVLTSRHARPSPGSGPGAMR